MLKKPKKKVVLSLPEFAIKMLYIGVKVCIINYKAARAISKTKKAEMSNSYYPRFAFLPAKTQHEWVWFKRYYEIRIPLLKGGYEFNKITEMDYVCLKLQGKTHRYGFGDCDGEDTKSPK
jgi:hypothetical protein